MMSFSKILLTSISFFFCCILSAQRSAYPDVLNLKTSVSNPKDIRASVFSDCGAWFAYALPDEADNKGFVGPLIMDMNGRWLSKNFSKLIITNNSEMINLDKQKSSSHFYPGLLVHEWEENSLKVTMQLIFVSDRQALISTTIKNTGNRKSKIEIDFTGETLLDDTGVKEEAGRVIVDFPKNKNRFYIQFVTGDKPEIASDSKGYIAHFKPLTLAQGESYTIVQEQGYYPLSEKKPLNEYESFDGELKKNELRWNGYLKNYFSHAASLSPELKRLAVKSIVTLNTNWRSSFKDLLHDGVFPSVNYQGFYGVWSWDSWKQAVGLSLFNPALAKENIRCMFDYQDSFGMIADCIYADKSENNWRDTKPPLSAWAVWHVFEQSRDTSFIKELYPKLVAYHKWWYANRDNNRNGLCEYGSTDGTRIAAAWESGMDNAVRFDSAVMLQNNEHAWSLDQESVDLNAYLYAEKLYLNKIASSIGLAKESLNWKNEASVLSKKINQAFYDSEAGYYFDKSIKIKQLIPVYGPEAWIPLWAGISNKKQATSVMHVMMDSQKFNTRVPLPTLAADDPKFNPAIGYWRGPVWLDQFYFGVEGLMNYGFKKEAKSLIEKLLNNAEGLTGNHPIHENYHPITGNALNAGNFSWSAAHVLMMLVR